MSFQEFLTGFIGGQIEVMVPNELLEGTLTSVATNQLVLTQNATIYGPGTPVTIPFRAVSFVRVLV